MAALLVGFAFLAANVWSKLAGVAGLAVAVMALFQPRFEKLKVSPEALATGAAVMLLVESAVIVFGAGYYVFAVRDDVNVLDKVTPKSRFSGLVDDSKQAITFDLRSIDGSRDVLTVGFDVVDTRPATGTCREFTKITFDVVSGGEGRGELGAEGELRVVHFPESSFMVVDLRVTHTKADKNCAVDVSMRKAVLSYG